MSAEKHEYGPVTEYHGTIDLPKVLSEGIRGGNPKTRSNRYIPEGMREEDLISYTHPDREMALAFAQDRANRMKLDPKKVGVVGVRGTQLPEAVEHQEPKEGIFGGTNSLVRPGSISPEYLIQASEDKMKPKKKKGVVLIISVGPKMPRKPTDEATPNKEVKKSFNEPMDIAFQLLKRELSPAARKHKLQYDTKYQSSPKRVKYRVELNRERRRRGIYGSGNGKDVSHTEGGKLTLENEHDNRARHFKNRGTLRKVKVKK